MLLLLIHNDGTGEPGTGNYNYELLINHTRISSGRFKGWNRSKGAWELVRAIVNNKHDTKPMKRIGDPA